jgi:hypothetical protein
MGFAYESERVFGRPGMGVSYCRRGRVLDAERFVPVVLYAQVALGFWTLCTAWELWRGALSDAKVGVATT